jgi:hypothetical protein
LKFINSKGKVLLVITVAASVVGGGIHALGAIGAKLGLEETTVDRSPRQRYGRGPR